MGALKYYNTTTNQWEYITNTPSVAAIIFSEDMGGVVDGTNTEFTTSQPFSSIRPFINGVSMRSGATNDFTVTGANKITFVTAPPVGSTISASYATSSTANVVGTNSFVFKETPTGAVNGSNGTFTTSQPYIAGSLQVFVNGLAQGSLVTETLPGSGVFTIDAPLTGDNVQVSYQYALSVSGNADTIDGIHAAPLGSPTGGQLYPLTPDAKFPTSLLVNPVKFSATETNGMAVAASTNIIFNNEEYDSAGNYNPATGLFTAPIAGFYHFDTNVQYAGLVSQVVLPSFTKNGVPFKRFNRNDAGQGYWAAAGGLDLKLAANDTVGVQAGLQGTTRPLEASWSYFNGHLISTL